jgi:hypothetical protein
MAGEHAGGCLSDQLPLLGCSHAPPELARWSALLGQLEVLAPYPPAAVLRLLPGHRSHNPGGEAAVWSGQS